MTSNIFDIINSKLGLLRDYTESEINCIEQWINFLIHQSKKESRVKKERCEVCNSKDDYFEGHHVSGRKHDYRQITACRTCHDELSQMQKLRDIRWLDSNHSQSTKDAFFLQGLYDILILKSKKTGNSLYEKYASLLIEEISWRLKAR
ncbi:MAG: hypothetical protein KC444_10470 [Nitrosopumilus sp.]|nr:hypothetical protein [Nitrosopumilus sp.]